MRELSKLESQLASREQVREFIETFGPRAAQYLAQGLSFAEACSAHCDWLVAENERLKRVLAFRDSAESMPLSQGGADTTIPSKRTGLASKIKGRSL